MSNSDELRWKQRLDNYRAALARLTEACELEEYSDLELAGLIKRFENCFESSWKVLKDLLFYEGFDEKTPRAVIRKSFEAGYIDENDCETLLDALQRHNLLSHTCYGDLAQEAKLIIKEDYHPALLRLRLTLETGQSL